MPEEKSICELVREAEQNYITGTTKTGKYVEFNLYENNEKIDAYINSRHTSGLTDSLGREKPFMNIAVAARNIWYRATDVDTKNLRIKTNKQSQFISTLLANVVFQHWAKKINLGMFLNDWGRALATYGSAMVKFVEKDGLLHCSVVPWNRLIVDSVDVDNDIKIEKLELTPAQLRKNKAYDQDVVKSLLQTLSSRENLDKEKKDIKNKFIPVYEVHGELSLKKLTEKDSDAETYVQQMHAVTFVARKDAAGNTVYDEFTLFKGREEKDPYMITHLIKEDGRATGVGAVEHLFEAQWMVNNTAKQIKDQLDLASKIIFQTSDGAFVGRNVLTDIETGDIFNHAPGQPLAPINNKADIAALQSYGQQWEIIGNKQAGISEAMQGAAPKANTAWRQTEAILQESHSLFELMTENKGLYLVDMMRDYILPYIKRKLNNSEEIALMLENEDITQIDGIYIPAEATRRMNKKIMDSVFNDKEPIYQPDQAMGMDQEMMGLQTSVSKFGNQRFFKPSELSDATWKEVFKDLEWDVDFDPTEESEDTEAVITTLNKVFETLADPARAAVLQTSEGKFVFNQLMAKVGSVSPMALSKVASGRPLAAATNVNSNQAINE